MTYKYPDAEFWLKYLTNEEIAYIILFSYVYNLDIKQRKSGSGIIKVTSTSDAITIDSESEYDDMDVEIVVAKKSFGVNIEGTYASTVIEGQSSSYNYPPEGGHAELDDATATAIYVVNDGDTIELTTEMANKSKIFNYKELDALAENCLIYHLEIDVNSKYWKELKSRTPQEFSPQMDERIKAVIKENAIAIRNAIGKRTYNL